MEHGLALLVQGLKTGVVDTAPTGELKSRGLEATPEAATPRSACVAFYGVVSGLASGSEGRKVLVVEQGGDLLANLHDEKISNWSFSIFRLRLSWSVQAYCKQAREKCRRVWIGEISGIPRSGV